MISNTVNNSNNNAPNASEPIEIKLNYLMKKHDDDQIIEQSLPSFSPLENLQDLKDYIANQFNSNLMNDEEPKSVKIVKVKDFKAKSGKKFRALHTDEDWTNSINSILQHRLDSSTTTSVEPFIVDFKIRMKKSKKDKVSNDKSERKAERELKKQERQEKRRFQKEESQKVHADDLILVDESTGIASKMNPEISRIIIDGNNLFFQTNTLRGLILKSKKKHQVEELLVHMAKKYSQFSETTFNQKLNLMHVVFDASSNQVNGTFNDGTFVVSSAKKEGFTIADDMLVELANRQNIAGTLDSCLFVTSDRGLRERLKSIGAKCIKSGRWMAFTHAHLCPNASTTSINEWTAQLLSEVTNERN